MFKLLWSTTPHPSLAIFFLSLLSPLYLSLSHIKAGLTGALALSILHSCFFVCLFSSRVLMNEAKLKNVPEVFTVDGNLLEVKYNAIFRRECVKISEFMFFFVLLFGFHLFATQAPNFQSTPHIKTSHVTNLRLYTGPFVHPAAESVWYFCRKKMYTKQLWLANVHVLIFKSSTQSFVFSSAVVNKSRSINFWMQFFSLLSDNFWSKVTDVYIALYYYGGKHSCPLPWEQADWYSSKTTEPFPKTLWYLELKGCLWTVFVKAKRVVWGGCRCFKDPSELQ